MTKALTRTAGDPPAAPAFTIAGYIVIFIGDQRFMLSGTVGTHIDVQYHRGFDDSLPIGTIPDMVAAVAGALGIADPEGFKQKVNDAIDNLKVIKGLPEVLKSMVIKVTDLGINTATNVYQFGFCCDLSASPISVGGLSLKGFGVKITYAKPPAK